MGYMRKVKRRGQAVVALGVVLACALLALCPRALALDTSLDIRQYAHTAWTFGNELLNGRVNAFAQTPDGYLWLGATSGLVRFDGVRAAPLALPPGQQLPSNAVGALLAARDGTLWIGTRDGLVSWKNGQLNEYPALARSTVATLLQDRGGTVWAGAFMGPTGKLCAIRSESTTCYGDDGSLGAGVVSLYEDSDGSLWVGATNGLWRWNPGPPTRYLATPIQNRQTLAQGDHGSGLIVAIDSIRQIAGTRVMDYPLDGVPSPLTATSLLRDRNGGLWIGTSAHGLVHSYQGKTSLFTHNDGLSSDQVSALFEDREGTIWVATPDGLDRFRELPVNSLSVKEGLSNAIATSILAARDGSIWIGTADGLNRWNHGRTRIYRTRSDPGLPDDAIQSLFEDERGRIWVSGFRGLAAFENGRFTAAPSVPAGLTHAIASDNHGGLWLSLWVTANDYGLAHLVDGRIVEQMSWQSVGGGPGSGLVPDPDGGIWTGLISGGIAHFRGGQIQKLPLSNHAPRAPRVRNLSRDRDGAIWAATDDGLSRITNGRVATLTTANGLPCDAVHWIMEDDLSSYWLYTQCGLVRIARTELDAWTSDPKRMIHPTTFDSADGIRLPHLMRFKAFRPQVTKASDGKIWFVNGDKVSFIDPSHIGINTLPPPVHIEQITANGKTYDATRGLRLPPRVHDLTIDYTALSLAAPEKIHFRFKLEGQDRDWREVVNTREVQYSNLAPGNYRFRVSASNNSGVWNEKGDVLDFSIAPAYYQTNWFRALCAATFLALLWAAYQFRVRQLQRKFRQLRDVIETIPAMAWTARPDGSNTFVNRRWAEYTGLSAEDSAGSGWTAAVHPEDRQPFWEKWQASLTTGEPLECEARFRCPANGEYRWLLARAVPLRNEHGKILRWYGILTDIQDRKGAEETLRESETRFRTFVDHATDAFFMHRRDDHGKIVDVNREACESLGYSREELIGKKPEDLDPNADAALSQSIEERLEAGVVGAFETLHRRKDGTVFPVEVRVRPFRQGGNRLSVSLVRDITDRKRAEEERERLRQLEADLAHINRVGVMGELAASIAHEVNQPLSGVVSNANACLRWLAREAPNVEEALEAVRDIVRDGKRAGEVIARVRALTRRTAPATEELDLNETIREVLALVGDEAKKKSVAIRTQFAEDLSPVAGDRVQLQQVVLNLVMNGIEAMSSVGERARQLVITTRDVDPDQVQVTVEDSGIGLDPDTMSRIFEPFYTTKSGGMGMGLSISRSILQSHGGRLWATAHDGPGTSFHFTLPKYQREESHARVAAV